MLCSHIYLTGFGMKDTSEDIRNSSDGFEMIGLIEFAKRMSVCPNTVRNWISEDKIVRGVHYFKSGHIYRFPWSSQFVMKLMVHMTPAELSERPKMRSHKSDRGRIKYRA